MMSPLGALPVGSLAVIFFSRISQDMAGYEETSNRMVEFAHAQDGFLGVESMRNDAGLGITISFWRDRGAAATWKKVAEHRLAQKQGSAQWYSQWSLHICTIDESRCFERPAEDRQ